MAYNNAKFSIDNLVSFTSTGLQTANFVQVRDAIMTRYRQIYGSDIDLSTASADGVFVNDLCLLINNILQTFTNLYRNLDVDSASGIYLDALCRLSNVTRKEATRSTASLNITTLSDTTLETGTKFVADDYTTWTYNGQSLALLASNDAGYSIEVSCDELGPVQAKAGSITQTLENLNLVVTQESNAVVGASRETDNALRARRTQSSGAAGSTVLESLTGALYTLDGIEDVVIYNNNSLSEGIAQDGTTVPSRSIYCVLRQREGVTVQDSNIGNILYEKMTPGIPTTRSNGSNGVAKNYEYIPNVAGQESKIFDQQVYWKVATPIHPKVTINLTILSYFDSGSNGLSGTFLTIASAIKSYMNTVRLSTVPQTSDLIIEAMSADPKFKGNQTYYVTQASVNLSSNPDTYFNYPDVGTGSTVVVTKLSGNNYKIEIGG